MANLILKVDHQSTGLRKHPKPYVDSIFLYFFCVKGRKRKKIRDCFSSLVSAR
jgi:hypothetical protein